MGLRFVHRHLCRAHLREYCAAFLPSIRCMFGVVLTKTSLLSHRLNHHHHRTRTHNPTPPHPTHPLPHTAATSTTRCRLARVDLLLSGPSCRSMEVDGAKSSAWRRRQRRLRSWLEHDRQTVAMELAAALHHSRDVGPGSHIGLWAQKTASSGQRPGVLTELEPQGGAVTVGYVAAPVPLLKMSSMAGDERIDDTALRCLVKQVIERQKEVEQKRKEKEKEWEEERRRLVQESVEQVRARVDAENAARHASSSSSVVKRRKRKKRR